MTELQGIAGGGLRKSRFLTLIRDFIVFEDDGSGALVKKMAGYHQFHAGQGCPCRDATGSKAANGKNARSLKKEESTSRGGSQGRAR